MDGFRFDSAPHDAAAEALRDEVRSFLAAETKAMTAADRAGSWMAFDPAFSRKVAARGWVGMTWPKRYGGHERSALERYVVLEEMLAAGAPVGAHWIADRQSGPLLLRLAREEVRAAILPRIARGECFFCIGMSEPGAGSDLAATRTRAEPLAGGGWRVNGTKIWTSHAAQSHYMILFCRTGAGSERHHGTSQLLVDMTSPGIELRPIRNLAGVHCFDEVVFADVLLPDSALIGEAGNGWAQVTSELAFERSGPERFLSSFPLLVAVVRALGRVPTPAARVAIGRLVAHITTLRHMSRSLAAMLDRGENPGLEAAIVKDLGAVLEQEIPELARLLVSTEPGAATDLGFLAAFHRTLLDAPSFSLRGGTREILRGIIARGLGLR